LLHLPPTSQVILVVLSRKRALNLFWAYGY
jgi:hypothetical protein